MEEVAEVSGKPCPQGCMCGRHLGKSSEGLKKYWAEDRHRQEQSERLKEFWSSEENREQQSRRQKLISLEEDYYNSRLGQYRKTPTTGHEDTGYFVLCSLQDHPLARNGSVSEHRLVLWEKLGCESLDCEHECHWGCGRVLTWSAGRSGIQADHLDGDKLNNDPENLVVSCFACNVKRARLAKNLV